MDLAPFVVQKPATAAQRGRAQGRKEGVSVSVGFKTSHGSQLRRKGDDEMKLLLSDKNGYNAGEIAREFEKRRGESRASIGDGFGFLGVTGMIYGESV